MKSITCCNWNQEWYLEPMRAGVTETDEGPSLGWMKYRLDWSKRGSEGTAVAVLRGAMNAQEALLDRETHDTIFRKWKLRENLM